MYVKEEPGETPLLRKMHAALGASTGKPLRSSPLSRLPAPLRLSVPKTLHGPPLPRLFAMRVFPELIRWGKLASGFPLQRITSWDPFPERDGYARSGMLPALPDRW